MKFTTNMLLTCILYFWDLTKQNNLMTTIPTSICKQHPNFRSTFIALATLVNNYIVQKIFELKVNHAKTGLLFPTQTILPRI